MDIDEFVDGLRYMAKLERVKDREAITVREKLAGAYATLQRDLTTALATARADRGERDGLRAECLQMRELLEQVIDGDDVVTEAAVLLYSGYSSLTAQEVARVAKLERGLEEAKATAERWRQCREKQWDARQEEYDAALDKISALQSANAGLTRQLEAPDERDAVVVPEIEVYKLSSRRSDRWLRLWQAEWAGCETAPRSWTRRGCCHKALRWQESGRDKRIAARRRKALG
jgi:hypothetical protein